jgi:hypothetical protein
MRIDGRFLTRFLASDAACLPACGHCKNNEPKTSWNLTYTVESTKRRLQRESWDAAAVSSSSSFLSCNLVCSSCSLSLSLSLSLCVSVQLASFLCCGQKLLKTLYRERFDWILYYVFSLWKLREQQVENIKVWGVEWFVSSLSWSRDAGW